MVPDYFGLILNLIRLYTKEILALGENVIKDIVKIIVMRIQADLTKGFRNTLTLAKCWNILKVICDYSEFISKYLPIIETQMLPMFQYIDGKSNVDFDEEIVLIVSSFLSHAKKVSAVLEKMFPHFRKIFNKNKHVFGHLFQCFNLYLIHGKEMF